MCLCSHKHLPGDPVVTNQVVGMQTNQLRKLAVVLKVVDNSSTVVQSTVGQNTVKENDGDPMVIGTNLSVSRHSLCYNVSDSYQ